MKKLLIVLMALGMITFSTNAQNTIRTSSNVKEKLQKHPHVKKDGIKPHRLRIKARRHRHHAMMQHLNLSDNQKQQAKLYRENNRKQLLELNKNENITIKEFREKKLALHKEQQAKMQSLLTPEQKTKMAQMKAEHKAKAEQHYAARMDKMKNKLSLTDNQVAQLKAQHQQMNNKLKAIKEDDKMDRTAKKEKLMALKAQMKADNKKIFTTEQLQKIEDIKKDKGHRHMGK
jgi:Spy/CpxP family protein refolding chaperone